MLTGLFGRRPDRTTEATYAAIVAQARRPTFYADLDVADTVKGRFDLIVAHMAVYCGRFDGADAPSRAKMQAVLDRFFADMEDNLREMGVTDTGVPKKMKGLAAVWLGRVGAYAPPLAVGDVPGLTEALKRNLYGDVAAASGSAPLGAEAVARYMIAARDGLAAASLDTLIAGRIAWPEPAAFIPAAVPLATGPGQEPQP
jgi:cytochrome b pre-mRNA-processing protein 3